MNEKMNEKIDEQTKIPDFKEEDKVESELHDFDSNPEIVGILNEISQGSFGDQYYIQTGKGKFITVGTYGVLKSKLSTASIGKWIKIVYKGEKISPLSKRKYKDFDVFVKKE